MSASLELSQCVGAYYAANEIHVVYSDGKELSFPTSANRRLRGQSVEKLSHMEISRSGLHWPDLDEDLSHAGIRAGRFGQP